MKVLICGGAGYIGSHMAQYLAEAGHSVTVLDNLSTGHRDAVRWGELLEADLLDPEALERALHGRQFDAVMHFAARSLVGESVADPYAYYANNVTGTLNLLAAMRRHNIDRIVFSSTAAVFGNPQSDAIDEDHPKAPINPYGASKLMAERILADAATAYGLRSTCLLLQCRRRPARPRHRRGPCLRNPPDPQCPACRIGHRQRHEGVRR